MHFSEFLLCLSFCDELFSLSTTLSRFIHSVACGRIFLFFFFFFFLRPNNISLFPCGPDGKDSACSAADPGSIPESGKCPGYKGMATHTSLLAWRIPWTEEPGWYSPWDHKESDTRLTHTREQTTFCFSIHVDTGWLLPLSSCESRCYGRASLGVQ